MISSSAPRIFGIVTLSCLALAGCSSSGSAGSGSSAASTAASSPVSAPVSSTAPSTPVSTPESSTASSSPVSSSTAPSKPASSPSTPASGKPFTVTLPAGYKSDPSKAGGIVAAFYLGPVVDRFAVNVNVTRESSHGLSVTAFERAAVAGIKQAVKIRKLTPAVKATVGGEPALSYSFEDTQAGINLKQGQVAVVHAGFGYVITYTAPVAQFDKQSPKAVQLIKSLHFN